MLKLAVLSLVLVVLQYQCQLAVNGAPSTSIPTVANATTASPHIELPPILKKLEACQFATQTEALTKTCTEKALEYYHKHMHTWTAAQNDCCFAKNVNHCMLEPTKFDVRCQEVWQYMEIMANNDVKRLAEKNHCQMDKCEKTL